MSGKGARAVQSSGSQASEGHLAKRRRHPALLVLTDLGRRGIQGLEVLLGRYEPTSREHAGQPIYEKVTDASGGHAGGRCFLYYWGVQDGEDQDGWWFGDEVGGAMVYCYAHKTGFPPPVGGWHIPAEDHPEIDCLRVVPLESSLQRASASSDPEAKTGATGSRPPRTSASATRVGLGTKRFEFGVLPQGASTSLGVQISSDFPPKILAVAVGSVAAQQGVPVGGVVKAINGKVLATLNDSTGAMNALKFRPLVMEVLPPDGSAPQDVQQASSSAPPKLILPRPVSIRPSLVAPSGQQLPARGSAITPAPAAKPQQPGTPPPAHLLRPPSGAWQVLAGALAPRAAGLVPPQRPGGVAPAPPAVEAKARPDASVAHVSVSVPEGATRRAAVLVAAFTPEEAECIEHLLLKVLKERLNGGGDRPLWEKVQELAEPEGQESARSRGKRGGQASSVRRRARREAERLGPASLGPSDAQSTALDRIAAQEELAA